MYIEVDPLIKKQTTDEEQKLLISMFSAIAKRDKLQVLVDIYCESAKSSILYKEFSKDLEDAKQELKIQRKITLGKLFYSNKKVWRYLTSPLKDKAMLEGE